MYTYMYIHVYTCICTGTCAIAAIKMIKLFLTCCMQLSPVLFKLVPLVRADPWDQC